MIEFANGGRVVESLSELPDLRGARNLYADFETTSGSPTKRSTNPHHHCDIAGIAVTVDDQQGAWYVPVGHHIGNNLPKENVYDWWCDVVDSADRWANHNIKYDAHVSTNWAGVLPECKMSCTLTQAKIVDSDRRQYGLDKLSLAWLHENIKGYEQRMKPYLYRNQDYGAIPIDIMGEYACQDVITGRRLDQYIQSRIPDQCRKVADVEDRLTNILFEVEREGMHVDPQQLKIVELQILQRMTQIDAELSEIVGRSFRAHVNADCFDVLCNQYGIPVLAWTDEDDETGEPAGNPSFDIKALAQYEAHPFAPDGVVPRIREFRQLGTLNSLFVTKYQDLEVNGCLHPSYNQCVRTGRMSCRDPNAQQLSAAAKRLIIPGEGESFISIDASQIEYRFIAHYINDWDTIEAYKKNPDIDFHNWMAGVCGVSRKPAKTMNFLIGFGGGKKLVTTALAANVELVGPLKAEVTQLLEEGKIKEEQVVDTFNMLAAARAEKVYDTYHNNLPSLKRTGNKAASAVKMKGYVFNSYGRHRHLPRDKAHIAFNTLCQSSAADLMKERMVAAYDMIKGTPIRMVASVHDEILFIAPTEVANDPRTKRDLVGLLEQPDVKLRVPIRWSVGISDKNWKEASSSDEVLQYDRSELEYLEWLK